MRPGRLYVTFWGLKLANFPHGLFRHRDVDAGTAQELIQAARVDGRLLCASSDDLVAPYKEKALSRHQALCAALEARGIPVGIEDFVVKDGEYHYTARSDLFRIEGGDRMIVVDCCYEIDRSEKEADFPFSFKIAPDSIAFHLFEAISSAEIGADLGRWDHPQQPDREASPIQGLPSVADSLADPDGMDPETDESVRKAAVAAFGARAVDYLRSPNFALGGRSPAEVLRRPDGLQIVLAEIQAQQGGAPI